MSMQVALGRFVFELSCMVLCGSIVDEVTCIGVCFVENFKLARAWIEYWQGGRCACTGTSIITSACLKASMCSPRGGLRGARLGDQNNRIDALCNLSDSGDRSYCANLQTRPTRSYIGRVCMSASTLICRTIVCVCFDYLKRISRNV